MDKPKKYWLFNLPDLRELIPHNFKGFLSIFSSLRSRNFQLYFFGQIISLCGSWIQYVALGWLVYSITGSKIMLVTMVFLNQIPNLVLTPFTGVLSDRFNKYRIICITQVLFMCQAAAMSVLVLTGAVQVWHIMSLALFNGIVGSIEAPARQSFYSRLVPPEDMTNAIALNSVTINGSRFIGPAIGGMLIALVGEGWCFALNSVSYLAALAALVMMRLAPFVPSKSKMHIFSEMREGFQYASGFLPLRTVILFVATISFFALPFMAIIPALVKDVLGGDSKLLGIMDSAIGAGAMVAALYLASRKHVLGLGKVVTITGIVMGLGLIGMSLTRSAVAACIVAVPLGFSLIGSMAAANTLLQSMVEDRMRGRVMSYFSMAFAGMAPLGGLLYGWMADTVSLSTTIFCSGAVCLLAAGVYERFRPRVRAAANDRYAPGNGKVNPEIATGIGEGFRNPF
jgi:MFS family permease